MPTTTAPTEVLLGSAKMVEAYKVEVEANLSLAELKSRADEVGVPYDDKPDAALLAARLSSVVYKRDLVGKRTVRITIPAEWDLMKAANMVTMNKGIWDSSTPGDLSESGTPDWVYSSDPALEMVLAAHFKCKAGKPTTLEKDYHTENGPPGVDVTAVTAAEAYQNLTMLRVDAGKDFQSRVMGDSASNGTGAYAPGRFMAVTETATAPAAADTALVGELTAGGFIRVAAAYAHVAASSTYTISNSFTSADATTRTLQKIGIFNALTVGTLVFETAIPSPPALVSGDIVAITETVTI